MHNCDLKRKVFRETGRLNVRGLTQGHFARDELGMLLCVGKGSNRYPPVGHGSPEVGAQEIVPPLLGRVG